MLVATVDVIVVVEPMAVQVCCGTANLAEQKAEAGPYPFNALAIVAYSPPLQFEGGQDAAEGVVQ